MREDMRAYTLNVTLTFITHPRSETFAVPVIAVSTVKDAGKLVKFEQNCTNLAVTNLAMNSAVIWAYFSQGYCQS